MIDLAEEEAKQEIFTAWCRNDDPALHFQFQALQRLTTRLRALTEAVHYGQ